MDKNKDKEEIFRLRNALFRIRNYAGTICFQDLPFDKTPSAREFGWLIELKSAKLPTYYGDDVEGELTWTTDDNKALRFARQEDAEKYIVSIGWTDAVAVEHQWG